MHNNTITPYPHRMGSIQHKFLPCTSQTSTRTFPTLPAHALQLLLQLLVDLAILRPSFAQLLHPQCCDDGQCRRLQLRTALVHRDIRRDAHLRDEVEILLIAVHALEVVREESRMYTYHSL